MGFVFIFLTGWRLGEVGILNWLVDVRWCAVLGVFWRGGRCVLWLQAPGFSDNGKEAFTATTFAGPRGFTLEEVEVFAVSGYP